jgi:methylmalonyl-CoA/ethylmalonyl-CoA epimerase
MTTLNQIGQIAVNIQDLDRAVAFYRDTLGMKFLFRPGNLAFFDCGGIRLMLSRAESPDFNHPASIIYYKVANLEHAIAELKSKNVKIESEPHLVAPMPDHDLWMAFIRDSENNLLGLMCEKPKATSA